MIISIVNSKGGSGKSTISTNLAAVFAAEGKEVLLIDADPEQHTSINWVADRPEGLPKIHAVNLPARNLVIEANTLQNKWGVIIIDGGARIAEHSHAAVAVADWLIIPCRPSKADMDATAQFLNVVRADMVRRPSLKGGLLLSMLQEGTAIAEAARKQIAEWDFPAFESVIHHRVAFVEALWSGMSAGEYQPKGAAADDIRNFYREFQEVTK